MEAVISGEKQLLRNTSPRASALYFESSKYGLRRDIYALFAMSIAYLLKWYFDLISIMATKCCLKIAFFNMVMVNFSLKGWLSSPWGWEEK